MAEKGLMGAYGPSKRKRRPAARRRPTPPERLEHRRVLSTVPFPLANPSFESPDLTIDNTFAAGAAGWNVSGTVGTTYEVPAGEASPAPDGDQYLLADTANWSLSQNGPTVAAGTRYILRADLYPLSSGESAVSVLLRNANTGQVLAGAGNFVSPNPALREVTIPEGEWTTVAVGFASDLTPAAIGATLDARIAGSHFAIDNVRLEADTGARDFYISTSSGIAGGDGEGPETAYGSLAALPSSALLPGDTVYLKAGDVFAEELNIRGKGTPDDLITVTRYGDGPNPILRPDDIEFGRALVWNNAAHAVIRGIDAEQTKIGFYLRYEFDDPGGQNVLIEDAHFRDLPIRRSTRRSTTSSTPGATPSGSAARRGARPSSPRGWTVSRSATSRA